MTRNAAPVALAVVALFLTGCSSLPASTPPATSEAAAAPTSTLECLTVSDDVKNTIASGANAQPITPGDAAAVKAPDMADAYLVAMTFTGPGYEDAPETGVWAVPSIEQGVGPILAIDGYAQEFTDWPGQFKGHKYTLAEPGAKDAIACLTT